MNSEKEISFICFASSRAVVRFFSAIAALPFILNR
jgi:hypothetical protein